MPTRSLYIAAVTEAVYSPHCVSGECETSTMYASHVRLHPWSVAAVEGEGENSLEEVGSFERNDNKHRL